MSERDKTGGCASEGGKEEGVWERERETDGCVYEREQRVRVQMRLR